MNHHHIKKGLEQDLCWKCLAWNDLKIESNLSSPPLPISLGDKVNGGVREEGEVDSLALAFSSFVLGAPPKR